MLVDSQRRYEVAIVGPVADDPSRQAREGRLTKATFGVEPAYGSTKWTGNVR